MSILIGIGIYTDSAGRTWLTEDFTNLPDPEWVLRMLRRTAHAYRCYFAPRWIVNSLYKPVTARIRLVAMISAKKRPVWLEYANA